MEPLKVLLRKEDDGRFVEVGTVLERNGKSLVVQVSDGRTLEHQLAKGEITPPKGSFVHLLRTNPEAVARVLEEQPTIIDKQLLAEAGKGLTAKQLKQRLNGVTPDLV